VMSALKISAKLNIFFKIVQTVPAIFTPSLWISPLT
jgi:hypothetical protein